MVFRAHIFTRFTSGGNNLVEIIAQVGSVALINFKMIFCYVLIVCLSLIYFPLVSTLKWTSFNYRFFVSPYMLLLSVVVVILMFAICRPYRFQLW